MVRSRPLEQDCMPVSASVCGMTSGYRPFLVFSAAADVLLVWVVLLLARHFEQIPRNLLAKQVLRSREGARIDISWQSACSIISYAYCFIVDLQGSVGLRGAVFPHVSILMPLKA